MTIPPADMTFWSLFFTALGGIGLKLVEKVFARSEKRMVLDASSDQSLAKEHATIRDELRSDNKALRLLADKLQIDLDACKEKYFAAVGKIAEQAAQILECNRELLDMRRLQKFCLTECKGRSLGPDADRLAKPSDRSDG